MRNGNWTRKSQNAAFTLVELLVVIGIIALLVSILLPALNRARVQAQTLACMSNLRNIGQAITIYTNNNGGMLPYGYWNGDTTVLNSVVASVGGKVPAYIQTQSDWSTLLMENVWNKGDGTYATEGSIASPVFQCPAADTSDTSSNSMYPIIHKLNYGCNPRLMPDIGSADPANSTKKLRPYRLSHVQRSSEVCLLWDAQQVFAMTAYPFWYGSSFPVSDQVDDCGLTVSGTRNGEVCNYLLMGQNSSGTSVIPSAAIWTSIAPTQAYYAGTGANGTNPPYGTSMYNISAFCAEIQWRHGVNQHTAYANFLFVDGHAETMSLDFGTASNPNQGLSCDVKDKNIYVNQND